MLAAAQYDAGSAVIGFVLEQDSRSGQVRFSNTSTDLTLTAMFHGNSLQKSLAMYQVLNRVLDVFPFFPSPSLDQLLDLAVHLHRRNFRRNPVL